MRISDWSSDVCSSDLVADAIEAEQQMDLLEVALLAAIAAPVGRGIGCAVAGEAVVCEGLGDARDEVLVLDLAGGGHHHLLRAVVGTQVVPQCATVERSYRDRKSDVRAQGSQ